MKKTFRWAQIALIGVSVLSAMAQAQTCSPNIPPAAPGSRFTDHGDGTLTDHRTGLMWKKCLEGQSGADCGQGSAAAMTWQAALRHAADHDFAGYTVWRLPNLKELDSIVERACYAPAINLSVFPNDPGSLVWSSSPYAYDSGYAWILSFTPGSGGRYLKYASGYVRLVRGGQ